MPNKNKRANLFQHVFRLVSACVAIVVSGWIVLLITDIREERSAFPEDELFNLSYGATIRDVTPERGQDIASSSILQRQTVNQPNGILFLANWYREDGLRCLSSVFVENLEDIFGGWQGLGADTHCSTSNYTASLKSQWPIVNHTVLFGFSKDAKRVKIKWRNESVSTVTAIAGAYLVIVRRRDAKPLRVEFLNSDDTIMHAVTLVDVEQ